MSVPTKHASRLYLLITALGSLSCSRSLAEAEAVLPPLGSPVPAFDFPLAAGGRIASGDLPARATIVALWSTTCGASRQALEAMAQLNHMLAEQGGRVVVLAADSDASAVQRALSEAGVSLPVALAGGELRSTFAVGRRWPWEGLAVPSFLVVDASGVVRSRVVGVEQDPARRLERLRAAWAAL